MPEIELTDATFEAEVLKSAVPVMVDFWAPWCGPCRMTSPLVEELAKEYEGKAKICKVNTDENPVSSSTYKITAIPSILFFKNGKIAAQLVGLQPKSEFNKNLDALL
ncbi:MAG: thioredoxin [Elusimicrobia bacterium]|nr:thioredoxin [Elusimicrobiota bacterium]